MAIWFLSAMAISRFPGSLWWWITVGAIIDGSLIAVKTRRFNLSRVYMYLPWFFGAYAALFLLLFIDRPVFRNLWLASVAVMSVFYWYRVELWASNPMEQETRMRRLGVFWLAFAVASCGIVLYAWQIFVGQNAWVLVFWLIAIIAAFTVNMWKIISKASFPEVFLWIIAILLVALELFWVIGFTTFGFASKGFLWASGVWYSWWIGGLIQTKKTQSALVLKGTAFLFASWIAIFLVTRWF